MVFIIHQLFLWVDQDPEIAFDRAALLFEVAEVTYDTSGILVNAAVDVANAAIIPIWNTASYYVVEPLVILVLELFVLVFTQKHYTGVYSEADFPYMGLDCTASATAAEWCGRYSCQYAHKLESAEKAPYYVNESANYNPARRLHGGEERDFYVFGVSTARRLQGIVDEEPQFVAPAFEMDEIVDALQTVGEMVITLAPAIFDAFFGIANTAGSSSFSVIIEGFISLVKGVLGAMRWLIKSGLFTTIVNIGVEFLVIILTELMIPLIFAAVDLLVCVLDLFKPSGWQVQFDCVEEECFAGPAATSDLLVFTSIPLALNVFVNILEATMNSNTAKRFFQPNKKLNAQGRTRNPDRNSNNEVLDTVPQDLPTNENPVYEFDFADDFANFMPTTSNTGCAAYAPPMPAKVPEARAIWMLVVAITTLVSEGNFNTVRPPSAESSQLRFRSTTPGIHTANISQSPHPATE